MAGVTVTRNPQTLTGWQATDLADLFAVWQDLTAYNYTGQLISYVDGGTNATVWRLTLSRAGQDDQFAYVTNWVVYDGSIATVYTAADFTSLFTAPT